MKKTLIALAVTAFAASSAHAFTAYEADGTKVQVDGSVRLVMEKAGKKTETANGEKVSNTKSQLRNSGSRIGLRVNHELGDGFYALGRTEFRFDGVNSSDDKFGDVYIKRAYAGFGKKEIGELTFGRQLTIADDYGQTDDYAYGFVPEYIKTSGNSVVRYDYKGIDGLQIGANYNFAQRQNDKGRALPAGEAYKNAYGLGAVYETALGDNKLNIEGGVGRTNYETYTEQKHYATGYELAVGYTVGPVKLVSDFGYRYEKEAAFRTRAFFVAPGAQIQVTDASRIYGNYLYERIKDKEKNVGDVGKDKTHGFLLGADYKFHKQVVAFVEGKWKQTKSYDHNSLTKGYDYAGKEIDRAIGVGMRIYW